MNLAEIFADIDWDYAIEVDVVSIILVIIASILAVLWYKEWAPLLKLNLSSRWSEDKNYLIVTIQFTNPSRLRLKNPYIYFLAEKYPVDHPFPDKSDHRLEFKEEKDGEEEYKEEVVEVYPAAPADDDIPRRFLYPGETITKDRIIPCYEPECVIQFGLQYTREEHCLLKKWSQTTTAMAIKTSRLSIGPLDINKAPTDALTDLPGVDDELAERIVKQREALGSFSNMNDLMKIEGISEAIANNIRPLLTFGR